jgi:hypothetical protein
VSAQILARQVMGPERAVQHTRPGEHETLGDSQGLDYIHFNLVGDSRKSGAKGSLGSGAAPVGPLTGSRRCVNWRGP